MSPQAQLRCACNIFIYIYKYICSIRNSIVDFLIELTRPWYRGVFYILACLLVYINSLLSNLIGFSHSSASNQSSPAKKQGRNVSIEAVRKPMVLLCFKTWLCKRVSWHDLPPFRCCKIRWMFTKGVVRGSLTAHRGGQKLFRNRSNNITTFEFHV